MSTKRIRSTERAVLALRLAREVLLLLQVLISSFLGLWDDPWSRYVLI